MRTGAIFARGSCTALKWMALLGVVLALGAGPAAAQITLEERPTSFEEGVATAITVNFEGQIAVNANPEVLILRVSATPAMGATIVDGVMQVGLPAGGEDGVDDFKESKTFTVTPADDDDAQDGQLTLTFNFGLSGNAGLTSDGSASDPARTDLE